jgi:hypothetical protein
MIGVAVRGIGPIVMLSLSKHAPRSLSHWVTMT